MPASIKISKAELEHRFGKYRCKDLPPGGLAKLDTALIHEFIASLQ